ncbi:hypothetical protein KRM28CT15_09580 [Krasilnikovia sp. M28-CT-15]
MVVAGGVGGSVFVVVPVHPVPTARTAATPASPHHFRPRMCRSPVCLPIWCAHCALVSGAGAGPVTALARTWEHGSGREISLLTYGIWSCIRVLPGRVQPMERDVHLTRRRVVDFRLVASGAC